MPSYAANLSMLWPELDVYDRFRAAADAGFRRVEILFVHQLDLERVEGLLRQHGLELVLFDPSPGDWDAGERGLMTLPGREDDFLTTIRAAVATAQRLDVPRLNVLAGAPPANVSREQAFETARQNLRAAAALADPAGITLLIEPINTVDMPGYFTSSVELGVRLVQAAERDNVRLQLDQYHVGMMGGDARQALRQHFALVQHVQVADVPGRHQPGTGTQPIRQFLADLDALGYTGSVGLEYRPQGSTDEALGWLPRDARG
jgi:hydroxypyruvate isomerase